jgi:hypothetical protein
MTERKPQLPKMFNLGKKLNICTGLAAETRLAPHLDSENMIRKTYK